MIQLDSRVASFRFYLNLLDFCKSHPDYDLILPKFSFADLLVYIFAIATIPFALIVALLEVSRTRKNISTTISMLIPIFITSKTFSRNTNKNVGFIAKNLGENYKPMARFFTSNVSEASLMRRIAMGLSSPLIPFNSVFPISENDKYIDLISYKVTNEDLQIVTEIAKLAYLPSLVDTYENTLCHYFEILGKSCPSSEVDSRIMLTCGTKISNPLYLFGLLFKRIKADAIKICRNLFLRKKYTWYVRVQKENYCSVQSNIDLENPKNGYYADPFLFEYQDEVFLFVEEFSFSTSKGFVSVFKYLDGTFQRLGICLEESFHISFPNVFVDGGNIYMIPETSENRDVRLYRAVDFPMKWELSSQLLTDISAVDSSIYKIGESYFLLTTVDTFELGDHATNLHIYKSAQLDSSLWQQSKLNPVVRDAGKGRNAGKYNIDIEGNLRLAQASEFGTYGKKIRQYEIQKLSLEEFIEKEIDLPKLNVPLDSQGHHHLSSVRDFKAFDFSRFEK